MNRCHADRISKVPISCNNAHSDNQLAPLLNIPQRRSNGFISSLLYNRLAFSLENHEVPRLETGNSERHIAHDPSSAAPAKRPICVDYTPEAYAVSYSEY